ncbi:MAG: WYL domain-containing protein [Candidatus Dormibacteraeota bacterium]|uniref:WYL domain-containing protein n=2 Tax=Candidatus Nephthysia bennettiae TaxID=3127016 RepID=A0A934K5H6_9BACT|nr:WYL domain-containing protein [Candidatus Dormibacteraeota bacterium]
MLSADFEKHDRTLRLMRELVLFQAIPHGLTSREVAERMGISQRQAQRDIKALEAELEVPFQQIGARWKVLEGYWLGPVSFSVHEAMAMLLSARLMLRFADRYNGFATAAYEKVASVLPAPMKGPVMEAVDMMAGRPADNGYMKVLASLTAAWAERRKVVVTYTTEDTFERVLWPLFLEPNATGHSCYLLAWDPKRQAVRSYKLERISNVRLLEERFDPPLGFSVDRHLAHAWGIWTSQQPVDVILRFDQSVSRRVRETVWHPSQRLEELPDGGVRVRLLVAEPTEIRHWILGWGRTCVVEAPESLRDAIAEEAAAMARSYSSGAVAQPPAGPARDGLVSPQPGRRVG